ncbi:signal peptidase II [Candidatus Dependentiae bacterium]
MDKKIKSLIVHIATFVSLVVADLTLKVLALNFLGSKMVRLGRFLNLHTALNEGVTWSLLADFGHSNFPWLLSLIGIVLAVLFAYSVYKFKSDGTALPEILVLAGGFANFVDRIWHGGVVDFIDLHFGTWHWASFNLADVCIVLGVVLIAKRMLYEDF